MYDLVDQRFDRLCKGSGFLLWATRSWTRALESRSCPPSVLAPAFTRMRIPGALPDFHKAMALFNRRARSRLVISPLHSPAISEDEAILLSLWRHAATTDVTTLRKSLKLVVEDQAVVPIEGAMIEAAVKLGRANLEPKGLSQDALKEMR